MSDNPLTFERTDRGFALTRFLDRSQRKCSLQKSSIATEDCIWLGCDEFLVDPANGTPHAVRMHLTQDMARALIGPLTHFVETGKLP